MTDKEKLRDDIKWFRSRAINETVLHTPLTAEECAALFNIADNAQAHLATLDAVSKEDAEKALVALNDAFAEEANYKSWEYVAIAIGGHLKTIRTLLRAAAGVKP